MRPIQYVIAISISVAASVSAVAAQPCDDFEPCTSNDMCSEGECVGTPMTGAGCDDGNACTVNDQCTAAGCTGSPAPDGTACGNGCGTCLFGFCAPDIGRNGQPCDDGVLCTTNDVCQFGFCFGTFRQCPDTDGNPCTADFCNPQTGQCQSTTFAPCPPCRTCRGTGGITFECDPAPNGTSCDDFNECTGEGMCQSGECLAGPPGTPGGATPTAPPGGTATPTSVAPTATPTGDVPCVGDCGGDGQVSVDEIIRAVNIALGNLTVNDCPAADGNGDGFVTVEEIVTAVNNALNGCP